MRSLDFNVVGVHQSVAISTLEGLVQLGADCGGCADARVDEWHNPGLGQRPDPFVVAMRHSRCVHIHQSGGKQVHHQDSNGSRPPSVCFTCLPSGPYLPEAVPDGMMKA